MSEFFLELFSEEIPTNLQKTARETFLENFTKLFENYISVAKDLNINLNKRPEELTNETYYKIAMQYEKLFG